jgi:hypothetical protein
MYHLTVFPSSTNLICQIPVQWLRRRKKVSNGAWRIPALALRSLIPPRPCCPRPVSTTSTLSLSPMDLHLLGEYDKLRRTTQKRRKAEASENSDAESEDDAIPGEIRTGDNTSTNLNPTISDSSELLFLPKHPQSTTHALRKCKIRHIPVLCGWPIPRRDLEDQAEKYAVAILALFRPWYRSVVHSSRMMSVGVTLWRFSFRLYRHII